MTSKISNLRIIIKKILIVILCAFTLLSFSSCFDMPETVTINNINYRSGFYGNLYPAIEKRIILDTYNVNFRKYYRVESGIYDLVCSTNSDFEVIYFIADSQWEKARGYYANTDNLSFYLQIGNKYEEDNSITVPDIDFARFNELLIFAKKNDYDPFNSKKNKSVDTRRMPLPDETESPEFRFYCDSNDGIFTSMKDDFFIIDGKLLLLFYYDFRESEEVVVCDVPEELGDYFIDLYSQLR